MRSFFSFLKKELLETVRSGKVILFGILFFALGVMNPVLTKLTPWVMELLAEDFEQMGMPIPTITVDALASWAQFFENILIGLIVFGFVYVGIMTKEYSKGTLILVLTKGLSRYKVLLAKGVTMLLVWTLGYALCVGITYGGTAYFWGNDVAGSLMPALVYLWLFGVLTVALILLSSVIFRNYGGVLLGTCGSIFAMYLLGLLPKLSRAVPTALMGGMGIVAGVASAKDYLVAVWVTLGLTVACFAAAIPIFNKKQL